MNISGFNTNQLCIMMGVINYIHHCIMNKYFIINDLPIEDDIKDPDVDIDSDVNQTIFAVSSDVVKYDVIYDKTQILPLKINILTNINTKGKEQASKIDLFEVQLSMNASMLLMEMNKTDKSMTTRIAEVVTIEFLKHIQSIEMPVEVFCNKYSEIDDLDYQGILVFMEDPNKFVRYDEVTHRDRHVEDIIFEHLKKLMVSHLYGWERYVLPHVPAFYIENCDLQYIDWYNPSSIHDLFKDKTINTIIKIV